MNPISGFYLIITKQAADATKQTRGVSIGHGLANGREVFVLKSLFGEARESEFDPGKIRIFLEKDNASTLESLYTGNTLAIFTLQGSLIAYNDYCCPKCFQSGQHVPGDNAARCEPCNLTWNLPRRENLKGPLIK